MYAYSMDVLFHALNGNKAFWGLTLVVMNIGSRFVVEEVLRSPKVQSMVQSEWFKVIVLFCMFFVGTKDAMVSLCMTVGFVIIIQTCINQQDSAYNILPRHTSASASSSQHHSHQDALRLVDMYKKQQLLVARPPGGRRMF